MAEKGNMTITIDDYPKAQRKGQRSYQRHLLEGSYPYLPVLDEILKHVDIVSEERLGVVQIPADLIVGTCTVGRRTAFAPNFMPLLERNTEFGGKWVALSHAHLNEGIRDPIKCYEFMNRYYVQEGNKRVSVLKYYGAAAIPGNVTRLIPRRSDSPENRVYFEYLSFYRKSQVNYILFTKPGSYKAFLDELGFSPDYEWTDEDRMNVRSAYVRFEQVYKDKGGERPPIPVADAFLVYLDFYPMKDNQEKLPAEVRDNLTKIWDEITMRSKEQPAEIKMEPQEAPKKTLLDMFIPQGTTKKLRIAFVYEKNAETSAWTYGHDLGRTYIEEQLGSQIETAVYADVTEETLEKTLLQAIADKSDIIFTTTPTFLEISTKVAIKYPSVKILNCSVDRSHQCVRTYYARLYEAKFLSGMVAGALSESGRIGYMADYPINGMIANINAFAIGAKMVNPRATVRVEWTSVKSREEILADFAADDIHYVSCQEMIIPNKSSRYFGLIHIENGEPENICITTWHWGQLYRQLIAAVRSGVWNAEESDGVALNYWWGMSADVIEFICSPKVPEKTRQLVEYMQQKIIEKDMDPFTGILRSQDGQVIQADENGRLLPQDIIQMRWLADNVIGKIPEKWALNEESKAVVEVQGIDKEEEAL